jgi:hypothetical protein
MAILSADASLASLKQGFLFPDRELLINGSWVKAASGKTFDVTDPGKAFLPQSGILQSLSTAYQKSPFAMIWPIANLAITVLICLALWQDTQTPAHCYE